MNGEAIIRQVIDQVVIPQLIQLRQISFGTAHTVPLIPDSAPFVDFEELSTDLVTALQSRPFSTENEKMVLTNSIVSSFSFCFIRTTLDVNQKFFRETEDDAVFFALYSSAVLLTYPISLGLYYAQNRDPAPILEVLLNVVTISKLHTAFHSAYQLIKQCRNGFAGEEWEIDVDSIESIHQMFLDDLSGMVMGKSLPRRALEGIPEDENEAVGDGTDEKGTLLERAQDIAAEVVDQSMKVVNYIAKHKLAKASLYSISAVILTVSALQT
eukprot:m.241574 g.241574  ORF g.241574 m.241574 type:complete len:269 (+) comp23448_c0_seq1:101-907(+)